MELLKYNEQLLINGGNEQTYAAGHGRGTAVRDSILGAWDSVVDFCDRVKNFFENLF